MGVFPPPTQPTNATNALASDTEHPTRHNGNAAAINDTVAELVDHKGDLLRHWGVRRLPGLYTSFGIVPSNVQGAAGDLILAPLLLAEDMPISEIAVWCQTAVAASTFTMTIYDDTGSLYPRNLLLQSAALDTATAGAKFEAVTAVTLPRGIVWLGGLALGGNPSITWGFGSIQFPFLHSRPSTHYLTTALRAPSQTAAPATAPPGMVTNNGCPRLFLKMA